MTRITIHGGRPLRGTVRIHGAKNAALPILAATAAIPGRFTLRSCPAIRDVELERALLEGLGVRTRREGETLYVDSRGAVGTAPDPALAGRLRGSVLLLGALLARRALARIPFPGGCVLGARPLDLHLSALEQLGAAVRLEQEAISCSGRLRGGTVFLRYPSVGATENLLLSALRADGPVRLLGAAREPEIVDLADFLTRCGASIVGAGTQCIRLTPAPLHGCDYEILPDRMEAATYLSALACAGGELTLTGLDPAPLAPVLRTLERAGMSFTKTPEGLRAAAGPLEAPGSVVTAPWPGFPTDAQPTVMAALLRAAGTTVFSETVFEDRFRHVPALRALGAEIEVAGRVARVRGVPVLHGAEMEGTDLRGAAALVCAALGAEGESVVTRADYLDRGYAELVPTLRAVGAEVQAQ